MAFGAYLFAAGLVWLVVLFVSPRVRWRLALYTAVSLIFALAGLALFYLLSQSAGLMQPGVAHSLNIPFDYLERGLAGVLILLIGLVGALSPVIAGWLVGQQKHKPASGIQP